MKSLNAYITENASETLTCGFITESLDLYENGETITNLYEELFAPLFVNEEMIDEGFLKKLAGALRSGGEKAAKGVENVDQKLDDMKQNVEDKVEEWSDAGKEAWENMKKKLGKKWDDLKSGIALIIDKIENALKKVLVKLKGVVETVSKAAGIAAFTVGGFMYTIARGIFNMINKGANEVKDFASRVLEDSKTLIGYAMLNFGLMMALKCDFTNDEINYQVHLALTK